MNTHELIGQVAAEIIKQSLFDREIHDTAVARFLLSRLAPKQVIEICLQVISDPVLKDSVEIKLPRAFSEGQYLPDDVFSDERATYWRNASCDKPVFILANNDDDQDPSLRDLISLDAKALKAHVSFYVRVASRNLPLAEEVKAQWISALQGLQQANEYTLETFAEYIVCVRNYIEQEQIPLIDALGYALPVLEIPRDSGYFQSIPEKSKTNSAKWYKLYLDAIIKRACLLRKHLPNQQRIDDADLRTQFAAVREDINQNAHPVIERFLVALDDWTPESEQLAQFEWEKDGISGLFTGLRIRKIDLATETKEFFENENPDELTLDDLNYLSTLSKRSTRDPLDEDKEFYDHHHLSMDKNRQLKSKWDRFVYGKPIECSDFLVGLIDCIERLNAQLGGSYKKLHFIVKTQYENGRSKWLEVLNHDVGMYFCTRYRGLDTLTRPYIEWNTFWLFKYDQLIEDYRDRQKSKGKTYTKNSSISRDATHIKFQVSLEYSVNGRKEIVATQLIWKCSPLAIGMELHDDLGRLSKEPFLDTSVNREPISKKGHLQEVSLDDVGTLDAAFMRDRGSLVRSSSKSRDIAKEFGKKLQEAYKDNRLSQEDVVIIRHAWDLFSTKYDQAIKAFAGLEGIASEAFLHQADAYKDLLLVLQTHASGDKNRVDLWHSILAVGAVRIEDEKPMVIIAPWHPLRLLAIAVKARQIAHFVRYLIENSQAEFGDDRLFFFHLKNDMKHPYYPEVAVSFQGGEPKLLGHSDTVNDYSLMELPLRGETNQTTTNENPNEASEKVRDVIKRYLELQPHKRSSLGIILYNCDSKGLPIAVVDKLTTLYDGKTANEVCCQVILRHQDTQKLNSLYEKMIDSVEGDPDAFIASESENDFMSKLRVGIMATDAATTDKHSQEKVTDIVFLQDVISRQAQVTWITSTSDEEFSDPIMHFPARWSRRHPTTRSDLRSIVYLVCPSQPAVGTAYLDIIHDVIGIQAEKGKHFLPARQVSFQDEKTLRIFQEVHLLGEWVVNYDDLLEKRLLQHQNVTVIKYQQNRSQERNLIISSTSSFQLLQALVKQRLDKLSIASILDVSQLANKCIEEAKSISGDIVLRAARRGANASELIGLVLSKQLIASELSSNEPVGWFFLDDYATWLGEEEEQIADIMALALGRSDDNKPILKILISEAKYVESNIADARKTSQKQLRETVKRIQDALFQTPGRLDRNIWLARLSDLIIDGVLVNVYQTDNIQQWREKLRRGEIQIEVKGYSHVFTPFIEYTAMSEEPQFKIPGINSCYQEVFGRKQVRELMLQFYNNSSLMPIRKSIGEAQPWSYTSPQYPSPDVLWNVQSLEEHKLQENGVSHVQQPSSLQYQNATTIVANTKMEVLSASNGAKVGGKISQAALIVSPTPVVKQVTTKNEEIEQWSQEILEILQRALLSYNLQAKVLSSRLTPNALLIRLKGSDRLRVEDIEKKRSVLLTTHGLSILNIMAQPGEIVVSIARPQREIVSLREVWRYRETSPDKINLRFILGIREIDGEILYLNLGKTLDSLPQHAPHTLIAGTTGSGKSVLMQNLLLDICQTNSSRLAQIYLIDPKKGVDYQQLQGLPHLRGGIITEQERAQEILVFLVEEMERRYTLLAQANAKNLVDYNNKVAPNEQVPVLWLIHDEFADWMIINEYKEAVFSSVQRLGIKARAAGIHLVFAAQRPDKDVLPLQLRDNLGNRLILRVESEGTSEIALGEKGAEKLLGRGHLAAKLNGEVIYAQVPFLSDDEQVQVVEEISGREN